MGTRLASWLRLAMAVIAVSPVVRAEPAPEKRVAITFDDLPLATEAKVRPADVRTARKVHQVILSALERRGAPATGFVVEASVRRLGPAGVELLAAWNRGAYELGNHSFSHADSNQLDLEGIRREIERGEATIGPLARSAGRRVRFFRFPLNHLGDTDEKRRAIEELLASRGYTLAAATIDTSDYVFERAYGRALARDDKAMQRRILDAYVEYSREEIAYYGKLNREVLGREAPAILLLHLNRVNAASLERVLDIFVEGGYRFISLSEAQSDPAYAQPPKFSTRFGPMWGYRWARERGVKVDGSREQEPPEWVARYGEIAK